MTTVARPALLLIAALVASGCDCAGAPPGDVDSGGRDAGPIDAGRGDAGPGDAGPIDAGGRDAGPDAGAPDAGVDAGRDAGADAGRETQPATRGDVLTGAGRVRGGGMVMDVQIGHPWDQSTATGSDRSTEGAPSLPR